MESCGFGVQADPKAVHPDQPWPHLKTAQGPSAVIPAFSADNPPTLGPAGTVHCSLEDWAKFAQFHLDGFNGKSSELLSAVGFQKLHQSYPGQEYTFGGWIRVNRPWARGPALTHAGSNTMNYANIWIAPLRKISFLSATNMGGDDAAKATDEVVGVFIKNLPLEP